MSVHQKGSAPHTASPAVGEAVAAGVPARPADAAARPCALPDDVLLHRLGFALTATHEASTLLLQRAARPAASDDTPAVLAESERVLDEMIALLFPEDSVVGTRHARRREGAPFCWYLDGLNASRAYRRRIPFFGIVMALTHAEQPVLGVIRLPALNETVYAARGHGAWLQAGMQQPVRAHVSPTDSVADALVCTTSLTRWRKAGRSDAFRRLHATFGWLRTWGECYGHCLVATGRAEAMLDPLVEAPLAAAVQCILPEAGGHWIGRTRSDKSAPFSGSVNGGLFQTIAGLGTGTAQAET